MATDAGEAVRAEVRKAVAALGRVEGLTLAELRAVLRAAITAATGHTRWLASVAAGERDAPNRVSLTLADGGRERV